jgi:bifunctional non-homologous end joining protein LigD
MGLLEYKSKRDFRKTVEPKGGKPLPKAVKGASRFVIQKHDARRLHYDFRLQMEGVLKSWAVPKGLPWRKGEKHLAVEVEDHPIEYETFEGVIPEGNYGAGTVMVWDRGKYHVYGEDPAKIAPGARRKKSKRRMDAGAHPWSRRREKTMADLENRSGRETGFKKT